MKQLSFTYICTILTILLCVVCTGCRDDFDFRSGGISDEETSVSLAIDFMPSSVGLTRDGYNGKSIRDVYDLCLVIFDSEDKFYGIESLDLTNLHPEAIERDQTATSNGIKPDETSTARYKFDLKLPVGTYYIYAVANLCQYDMDGNLNSATLDYLNSIFPSNSTSHINRREFCELRRSWDSNSIKHNSELTGFVVNADENGVSQSPSTLTSQTEGKFDLPGTLVMVEKGRNNKLHCWLRRMASKVTVTFDASDMSDKVSVFVHDVRIRDIVKSAPILTAGRAEATDSIFSDSQCLAYCSENDIDKDPALWKDLKDDWPELTKSNWSFDQNDGHDDLEKFPYLDDFTHANSAKSLFFYENMQGEGESKLQDSEGGEDSGGNIVPGMPDGIVDYPGSGIDGAEHYKDNKPFGTYVEVRGYYVNQIRGEESEGPIVYRFMLGKNTTHNYDCERNYHYKLTLKLKGRANEVDWHIDYQKSEERLYIPSPYYISYGYNESIDLPIKVRGKVTEVKATILKNNWYPNEMWKDDTHIPAEWRGVAEDVAYAYSINFQGTDVPKSTALGFLTLYKPKSDAIGKSKTANDEMSGQYLLQYWSGGGDLDEARGHPLYSRTYALSAEDYKQLGDETDGVWRYSRDNKNGVDFTQIYVPLYTRERNLVKAVGYSGQNPYDAYQRRAKVRFEVKIEGETEPLSTVIDIVQVVRITNPTGVWRAWNNARPFHVALNHVDGDDCDTYTTLDSHGAWSAEVILGADWILLNGKRQKIYGANGSKIEFDLKPISVLTSDQQYRCGIVEVRYHDYCCVHKIYIRQGYVPIKLVSNGVYWHTSNMVTRDSEGTSPLDEGSMFRFGKWEYPIASSNNYNDKTPWVNVVPGDFKSRANKSFTMADGNQAKKWDDIGSLPADKFMESTEITINGWQSRMMKLDDILELRDNPDIAFVYGVLYGDEASSTLFNVNEAFGYKSSISHQQYGMRGCFVYNKNTGNQIFFPIGSAGYGRIQHSVTFTDNGFPDGSPVVKSVVLKYTNAGKYNLFNSGATALYRYMKPFYTLFKSNGAMYWLYEIAPEISYHDEIEKLNGEAISLDLNYTTYDFNPAPAANNTFPDKTHKGDGANRSDACFIRLVSDQKK